METSSSVEKQTRAPELPLGAPRSGSMRVTGKEGAAVASSVSKDDLPVEKMGEYESRSGALYYLRPGHWFESVTDSEAVEFSPTDQLRATVEVVQRNMSSDD